MRVCIGGTFNILHKGHKKLIDTAVQTAGKNGVVYIGVTGGKLIQNKKFVHPYNKRVKELEEYLASKRYNQRVIILKIADKYGFTLDWDFDAIVVSPETLENAKEINQKRINCGKKPLKIVKIFYVLAEDKKPISSTRILNNEIDTEGRIIH